MKAKVGVFDSGIGGLTVLSACAEKNPEVDFYYLGDNSRAPYGDRSPQEIVAFVREGIMTLREYGITAVLLACNTATAVAAETVRREFDFPVLGMEPAVKPAAKRCQNVLILATPRTAESARLKGLIEKFPSCRFTVFPTPRLAGEIEHCLREGKSLTISDHLPPNKNYDGVVLGCTHYCFLRKEIEAFYRTSVFDGNKGTADRLSQVLAERKIGRFDHHFEQNTNKCLSKKLNILGTERVFFVGKGAEINQKVYFTNVCFKNF